MSPFQIHWPLIILYFLGMLAIGIWAARTRVSSVEDMAVAGRSGGVWLVTFSVAATWINGVTLIGITGVGKNFGLSSYWTGGSFLGATIWLGYYVIPRLRQSRIITVPQLFGRYFGPKTHLLSLILCMLRDLGATSGVMGALALVTSNIFQISVVEALLLTYILMLVYVFLGGMWAILLTDAIQFLIILFTSVWLVILAFSKAGGLTAIKDNIPADLLGPIGPAGAGQVVGWAVLGLAITLGYQTIIQRGLAASDHDVARKGFLYGGIIGFFWYMIPPLLGISGRAIYGSEIPAGEVFLRLCLDLGGPLGTILVISILAGSMSTLDSTINTIASNFSIDVYGRYINPKASPRRQLWIFRINIILVGLLAVGVYYMIPLMMELFWLGGRIMGASLAPALVALVLFPRTRRAPRAVFVSMLLGALVVAIWQLQLGSIQAVGTMVVIWSLDPILVGLPLGILSLWIGTAYETRNLKPKH